LRAFAGVEFAAMPRAEISEAAAAVARAVEKTRLSIVMVCILRNTLSSACGLL
jgi:hypothetical protein